MAQYRNFKLIVNCSRIIMKLLKEFFNKRVLINCLVFSVLASLLILLRVVFVKHIPFFSNVAMQVFVFLACVNFVLFRLVFFILFWLSQRRQEE